MIKPNPFTPKSGLEPKVFTNREEEIEFFLRRIKDASAGNINHYNKLKINGLRVYFKRLVEKGILENIQHGKYKVKDILLCEYIREIKK